MCPPRSQVVPGVGTVGQPILNTVDRRGLKSFEGRTNRSRTRLYGTVCVSLPLRPECGSLYVH